MAERRRYTKRQKAAAVVVAEMSTIRGAADATGVPESTLRYWMDDPKFARFRAKTREDLAKGFELLAHSVQEVLMGKVPEMEPRDLTVLLGVSTDKAQLLSGAATHRIESKDVTDVFDDHETRRIVEGAREYLEGAGPSEGKAVVEEAAVEGAGA